MLYWNVAPIICMCLSFHPEKKKEFLIKIYHLSTFRLFGIKIKMDRNTQNSTQKQNSFVVSILILIFHLSPPHPSISIQAKPKWNFVESTKKKTARYVNIKTSIVPTAYIQCNPSISPARVQEMYKHTLYWRVWIWLQRRRELPLILPKLVVRRQS